ncbi:MAG: hypothetical protein AABX11_03190 [Nanoarchaeota archaeon]
MSEVEEPPERRPDFCLGLFLLHDIFHDTFSSDTGLLDGIFGELQLHPEKLEEYAHREIKLLHNYNGFCRAYQHRVCDNVLAVNGSTGSDFYHRFFEPVLREYYVRRYESG